jgi:hypothetical protein
VHAPVLLGCTNDGMGASDLLGNICGASMPNPRAAIPPRQMASTSFSPNANAITIQTAYRRYYLSDPELCHQIAPTLIYKGDKAPWISGWITKEALLHTAAFDPGCLVQLFVLQVEQGCDPSRPVG